MKMLLSICMMMLFVFTNCWAEGKTVYSPWVDSTSVDNQTETLIPQITRTVIVIGENNYDLYVDTTRFSFLKKDKNTVAYYNHMQVIYNNRLNKDKVLQQYASILLPDSIFEKNLIVWVNSDSVRKSNLDPAMIFFFRKNEMWMRNLIRMYSVDQLVQKGASTKNYQYVIDKVNNRSLTTYPKKLTINYTRTMYWYNILHGDGLKEVLAKILLDAEKKYKASMALKI